MKKSFDYNHKKIYNIYIYIYIRINMQEKIVKYIEEIEWYIIKLDSLNYDEIVNLYYMIINNYDIVIKISYENIANSKEYVYLKLSKLNNLLYVLPYFYKYSDFSKWLEAFNLIDDLKINCMSELSKLDINNENKIIKLLDIAYLYTKAWKKIIEFNNEIQIVEHIYTSAIKIFDQAIYIDDKRKISYLIKISATELMWKTSESLKTHYDLLNNDSDFIDDFSDNLDKNGNIKIKTKDLDNLIKDNKIIAKSNKIIFQSASFWALITIHPFPIPMLDYFLIVSIQINMLVRIWKLYWIKLNKKMAKEILVQLSWTMWFLYFRNHIIIFLTKLWIPIFWGYIIIPFVFAFIYWMWKVFDAYYYYQYNNIELNSNEIKQLFTENKNWAWNFAKQQKNFIIKEWRKQKL